MKNKKQPIEDTIEDTIEDIMIKYGKEIITIIIGLAVVAMIMML